jgi:hypothetical protein
MREADYYPIVERWMKKHFGCFKTRINVGTTYSMLTWLASATPAVKIPVKSS